MMLFSRFLCLFALFCLLSAGEPLYAQETPAINQESILMLQAVQKAMTGDYKGAETAYGSVIAANPQNTDAYIQRGVLRRELGNLSGAQSDGKMAINLATQAIAYNAKDARAYHRRGMAERLLNAYPQAKQDIQTAIELGGDTSWESDLRDTMLEEKASQGVR